MDDLFSNLEKKDLYIAQKARTYEFYIAVQNFNRALVKDVNLNKNPKQNMFMTLNFNELYKTRADTIVKTWDNNAGKDLKGDLKINKKYQRMIKAKKKYEKIKGSYLRPNLPG